MVVQHQRRAAGAVNCHAPVQCDAMALSKMWACIDVDAEACHRADDASSLMRRAVGGARVILIGVRCACALTQVSTLDDDAPSQVCDARVFVP